MSGTNITRFALVYVINPETGLGIEVGCTVPIESDIHDGDYVTGWPSNPVKVNFAAKDAAEGRVG